MRRAQARLFLYFEVKYSRKPFYIDERGFVLYNGNHEVSEMADNKRKRKSALIPMILAVVAVVLIVQAIFMAGDVLFGSLDKESVTITIGENPNSHSVAQTLKENHIIKYPWLFELMSNIKGADGKYYSDEFEIHKGSGYNLLINGLTYADRYRTTDITIPEGSTLKEITNIVAETGYITAEDFTAALNESYDYDFLQDIDRENPLEGYLFPDTYNISNQMSGSDIVKLMLDRFEQIFTDEYRAAAQEAGYDMDEIVTLASIIEAEAGSDADRPLVSSVFHNRLDSTTYPYLESCATVQYILGERKPILSNSDIQIDSPYNTYINKGLPIGPICSPGKASIEAALYPADTDYYFFQSDADGKIYYSETYSEHEQIMNEIQP